MRGKKADPHAMIALHGLRWLYSSAPWKRRRAAQLRAQPLCEACAKQNIVAVAVAADHRDGFTDFNSFATGRLQSLCHICSKRQATRPTASEVRFRRQSGHWEVPPPCPLMTQSRHRERALDWCHQGLGETRPLVFALPTFTQPAA